ncbi:MAG TPA: DNA recombination protein RmuC, partial [Puia sp.]|nr:DNA recombination protein RmuC [Puia sp.]
MNNIYILGAVGLLLGCIIGWLIARGMSNVLITRLRSKSEHQDELVRQSTDEIEKLGLEVTNLRENFGLESKERTRAESKLQDQIIRQLELQIELKELRNEKSLIAGELDSVKGLHTTVKTKYEKLFADNIENNNEKIRLKDQVEQYRVKENELNKTIAGLTSRHDEALRSLAEQKLFVEQAQKALKDSFDALSAAALDKNNQSFLDLAKTALTTHVNETKGDLDKRQQAIDNLVKPLGESLSKMDEKINSLENKREGAYGNISALLDQVKMTTGSLDKETRNLVTALKTSHTRGRYGEIALRRLVEFAGMVDQCDFVEQESSETETGRLRPDMIIKLPENRKVVVDSKVPLSAYLKIFETDDADLQKVLLAQHVTAIKGHLKQLGGKAYWDQFEEAPDFVVLFMQIESSFGAALQAWPELIEEALNNRIIVATPTTLITILRSVGYSWNQLKTMENIESIRDAAVELYERSAVLINHIV